MEFYIRNTKLNEIQEEPFKTKEDAEKTIAELKEMFGDYYEITTEKYVEPTKPERKEIFIPKSKKDEEA